MITDDYQIKLDKETSTAVLEGALRLQSPNAYDIPFSEITNFISQLPKQTRFILNIKNLEFLNSSGVTSLAKLVLLCRSNDIDLHIECNEDIPWQEKTIASFNKLYERVSLTFSQ